MLGVAYVLVQCLTCLFSTTTVERFFFYLRIFFFFLSVCWVIRCFGLGVRDAKSFRMGIRPLVINRLYLRKMSWIKIDEPPASNWSSLPWERAHCNASKLTYFGFRLTLRWLIGMHCCVLHVTTHYFELQHLLQKEEGRLMCFAHESMGSRK